MSIFCIFCKILPVVNLALEGMKQRLLLPLWYFFASAELPQSPAAYRAAVSVTYNISLFVLTGNKLTCFSNHLST